MAPPAAMDLSQQYDSGVLNNGYGLYASALSAVIMAVTSYYFIACLLPSSPFASHHCSGVAFPDYTDWGPVGALQDKWAAQSKALLDSSETVVASYAPYVSTAVLESLKVHNMHTHSHTYTHVYAHVHTHTHTHTYRRTSGTGRRGCWRSTPASWR
jgi:hypothetical protein